MGVVAFLQNIYGDGEIQRTTGSGLGFAVDTEINSIAKDEIANTLSRLPQELGQKDVENEFGRASEAEVLSEMLKKVVEARKRQVKSALDMHKTAGDYQQYIQDASLQAAAVDADFASALASYGLNLGIKKAEVNGKIRGLERARTIIR